MATPLSIIIPAFNQLEYCRQCIATVLSRTERAYKLILVDNGSTDGVGAFFDSVAGATVVHSAENKGFAGGVNLGLAHAEGHVLLLNSDTLTPRGWLTRLEQALLSADDIGMVGPRSNCVSGGQQIDGLDFADMEAVDAYAAELAERHAGRLRGVARLVGFCLLIRDKAVAELGAFDEGYGIGNYEDDDYCLRALRAGYRLCVAEDCFVFHYGSRTFAGMGIVDGEWQELMRGNARRFEEKLGAAPRERSDAVQQARQLCKEAGLEVEAGRAAEAIRLYRDAIALAPAFEEPYHDLGLLLLRMGHPARAMEQFKHALMRHGAHAEARKNLLAAAETLGRTEEARSFLERRDALRRSGRGRE